MLTKVFPSALELKLKPVLSPVQIGLLFPQLMLQISVICLPGQVRPELVRLEDPEVADAVGMLMEAVGMLTEAVGMLAEAIPVGALELIAVACVVAASMV